MDARFKVANTVLYRGVETICAGFHTPAAVLPDCTTVCMTKVGLVAFVRNLSQPQTIDFLVPRVSYQSSSHTFSVHKDRFNPISRKVSIKWRLPYHESKVIADSKSLQRSSLNIVMTQEGLSVFPRPCLLISRNRGMISPIFIVIPNIFCPFIGCLA